MTPRAGPLVRFPARTFQTQYGDLSKIYTAVLLRHVPANSKGTERSAAYGFLRYVLEHIAVLFSWLPSKSIAGLLGLEDPKDQKMLKELCTLLLVRENRSRLPYPCYPPLCWALLHHTRATTSELHVHVNIRSAHRRMLINCIRLMSTRLKKDICNLGAPATLFQAIPIHRVAESIPPELRYSCLYWGRHLQMSGIDVYDNDFIHGFLTKHLLHWLEVLSLIGRAPEAICVTSELFSRVSPSDCPRFYPFLQDAKQFALQSQHCLQQAPLQVYASALAFAPVQSVIRRQFQTDSFGWLKEPPGGNARAQDGGTWVETPGAEGHSSRVNAVAFSHDGTMVASASVDTTICLWDTTTRRCVHTLRGHHASVNAVAFHPAGSNILASGSADETIRVWDITTGQCLRTLEGHSGWINTVAFSPDGDPNVTRAMLASGSVDATICLWDYTTGTRVRILRGHTSWVRVVAFNAAGTLLASGSGDRSVCLWDPRNGRCLHTLRGHGGWVTMVKFSSDGKILASISGDRSVRLWDTRTGQCLKTLQTLAGCTSGFVCLDAYLHPRMPNVLSVTGAWVVLDTARLLWIPPRYRTPTCVSIQDNMVALGYSSGQVVILVFRFDE